MNMPRSVPMSQFFQTCSQVIEMPALVDQLFKEPMFLVLQTGYNHIDKHTSPSYIIRDDLIILCRILNLVQSVNYSRIGNFGPKFASIRFKKV